MNWTFSQMRSKLFPVFIGFCFIILWFRLFQLQVVKGNEITRLASENRIKIIKVPALRGVIYDRNAKVLVRNRPEGRDYLYGDVLAHVSGYIGEVSPDELKDSSYQPGDIVGKMGVEKQYDKFLRGKDGGILVETDVNGKVSREIKKIVAKEGQSLTLTIDIDLQKKVSTILNGRKGAVVVSDPRTGEILSLVSSPSFDPNLFTMTSSWEKLAKLFSDSDQPMFNRAISGLYPPGSVFKIVTAVAGLEEGKISKSTLIEDTGEIVIEHSGQRYAYANWYFTQYGKKEEQVDILKAIQRSNDIYFYKVGEWLGISQLADWAHYFGLGQKLGIDLPSESGGLVPTPEWKKEKKTESWYLGDTYITAIGQGNLQLTPLQVNQLAAIIAGGGNSCPPHLLKEGQFSCQSLKSDPKNIELVKEGMKRACEEKGTAPQFADLKVKVGCKTGTAEIGDPQKKTHAWFTVFAPWENPEIVITVLLEKAGEGSQVAGPVAKEILQWWFAKKSI